MFVYIRKLFPHDVSKEISFTTEIGKTFLNVGDDFISKKINVKIPVFLLDNPSQSTLIELQGATDPRFSTILSSFISTEDKRIEEGDFLYMVKKGSKFGVKLVKKGDILFDVFNALPLNERDRHYVAFSDEPQYQEALKHIPDDYSMILSAIRTKPFLLLAGISGTGKSRIVREFAFMSCPKVLQDEKKTTPGNYLMVEVKPNWHDSTELLGYYSNISKKYIFTKFVKFLVKAMMYPDVPFFVCLDEMNLAPVEQYFAEFLSVLETRRLTRNGNINTGALVDKEHFIQMASLGHSNGTAVPFLKNNRDIYMKLAGMTDEEEMASIPMTDDASLLNEGLTLPDNVIIVGTVNMDDTTYKFSRKVIDRAMTIEMNGGELSSIFGNQSKLQYRNDDLIVPLDAFKSRYVSADDAVANCKAIRKSKEIYDFVTGSEDANASLARKIKNVNFALEGTPFQVSYRVMNELVIYFAVLLDEAGDDAIEDWEYLSERAVDEILLMKVLPRVEGDDEVLALGKEQTNKGAELEILGDEMPNKLHLLKHYAPEFIEVDNEEGTEQTIDGFAREKLNDMIKRLNAQGFTRFWP